ncbi:MAG TPA: tyrosine-type recombinase/integrase [Mycobacterium sp.]
MGEVVRRADAAIVALGHAPSTLWQYRWAWSQFASFCSREGAGEVTEGVVASFLRFVAAEHRQGRIKDWKRKLLRKSTLVLAEVARTGSYQWRQSRRAQPNDVLDVVFRPVQEQFEAWLGRQRLAMATRHLYATVSRTVLAWLPGRGVTAMEGLSHTDVSAAVVFLASRYSAGSMRTVLTAVRVLCRFLEDSGYRAGLSAAVPTMFSRRVRSVTVLPADRVDELIDSPDPGTPQGLRDRALLLLAARTGLRPVDIVDLRLGDIDWQRGRLTLTQHKTGTALTLPLLSDVGDAIAGYLLHGRPGGVGDDHVFLRTKAPFTHLSAANDLYHVAARAFDRTQSAGQHDVGRGFRVLRASLATRMLEGDTPLPVISGALGHRGIESAKHYLAADEKRMRGCCLDFAGIEPAVTS